MKRLLVGTSVALALIVSVTIFVSSSRPAIAQERSSAPRSSAKVSTQDQQRLSQLDTDFALKLLRASTAENDNSVTSPYGLLENLSMVKAGASGNTLVQIDSALGANGFANWDAARNTQSLAVDSQSGRSLSIANAAFVQKGYPINSPFLDTLAQYYGTGVYPVDFENDTSAAKSALDRFAREKTHGMIKDAGSPPDASTRVELLNTAFLDAKWKDPFEAEDTMPGAFTTADGMVTTDFMEKEQSSFDYSSKGNFEIARLPYKGSMSMLVVLPKPGQFKSVRQTLTGESLVDAENSMTEQSIFDLKIPKFKINNDIDLGDSLKTMGITDAFDQQRSDFSKLSPSALCISDVEQRAVIDVDEKGTKAAAVTKTKFEAVGAPIGGDDAINFIADRPFLYFVVDDSTKAILFMGQVTNPAK